MTPPTVDLHTHMLPRDWPDLEARYGYPGFVRLEHHAPHCARMMIGSTRFRDVESNLWDPERRLRECAAAKVDLQVLSTVPVMFSYWAKPHDALDLSVRLNDHLATVVQRHPDRFVALGTVPLQDAELASRELLRCRRELWFPGVQIGTNVNGSDLDDPALAPFWAAAEECDAAVFLHPWEMLGKERMQRYWFPWLVGMPTETALAAGSLIFGGVLARHPRLKIGLSHGGGAFPWILPRMAHGHSARPDLCATVNPEPPERSLRRFYFDALVHDERHLEFLVRLAGSDRVALGSDYPFPLGESIPGELIRNSTRFDQIERERLLGGTALEFLGLDAGRFRS